MAMRKHTILVLGEQNYGVIHPVTYELLQKAQELAKEMKGSVECLILGPQNLAVEDIAYHGADLVYYMEHECFQQADEFLYKQNIEVVLRRLSPEVVLIGATAFGRSLAPRIAGAMNTGLTADCTDLKVDANGQLIQIRPAFSDNILAYIRTSTRPQMATIRYKEFNESIRDSSLPVNITKIKPDITVNPNTEVLSHEPIGAVDITKVDVIVAAGRGFRKKEDLAMAQNLADSLGGVVAVSRALVDAGMAQSQIQVGYSGHRVKPKIYFACGISGAPQHLAGMKESDIIIAVNNDASAPIFKVADIGYVGDIYEILPKLAKRYGKESDYDGKRL